MLREDAPDYMISGRQLVTLSGDNNKIFNARPQGGSHLCQFIGFASRDAEPPTPRKIDAKTGTSKKGQAYKIPEHLEFTALFQILGGQWKGYQLANNVFYAFLPYEGGITQIKGTGSQKLEDFLMVTGLDFATDDIPFSENVLPFLEKLLLSRGKKLIIGLSPDGWVDTIVQAPEGMGEEEPTKATVKIETKAEPQVDVIATMKKMVADGVPGAQAMLDNLLAQQAKTPEQLVAQLGYDA